MMKFATLFHQPYDGFRCEPSPVRGAGGKDWNGREGDIRGAPRDGQLSAERTS
jgi:hypothetical protein